MSIAAPRLDPAASTGADLEMSLAGDLASFFDVSLDLLCIRDMALNFTRVNRTWETVLGYSAADLEGAALLPLVHPDDVAATQGHMERMVTEDQVLGFINRYRHKDGGYRHLEWRARRVGDKVYGVARDVTERLAAEAAIKAAQEAAETASQAKSDFLANISHEIRTPLNGVIGLTAALKQTELTPAQHEIVRMIESSGVTLERLVSDILDVSRIEAGQVELEALVFNLRHEIDGLLETHRLRAEAKGLDFRVEHDGDDAAFVGDITRIKQVLGNLLSNAVKFTEHGEVRVRVAVHHGGATPRLDLCVEDTGVGFDAPFAAGLFQRFSQADTTITRRFGGSGLGLSICKALVEMMGGEITAWSRPNHGSRFTASLPLTAAPTVSDTAISTPDLHTDQPLRVLLAEDHPVNQRVVQLLLSPYGAEVTVVEDGVQALEAFQSARFDLVLMDMQMPHMDGLAATQALRAYEAATGAPRTPIAMLSANAMDQHRQNALNAGADVHIAKPINAERLIGGIQAALEAKG